MLYIEQWWNTFIFRAGKGKEISVDDFVLILLADYKKDKTGFKDSTQKCFEKVFDVIDMDKGRTIDLDEFVFAIRAFGHENGAVLKSVFDSLGQKKGHMKKLVDSWIQFVCDEDKSKKDVLLDAF
ncbi:sarcoplasmic calcium-binding protein-like [Saccostrea cucullata]|uniref:sarcoplasmic calcium-binding protein-like n=1 Tax=Saccostrea cuccullata TaxID=36930 RepID=UPI002ED08A3A